MAIPCAVILLMTACGGGGGGGGGVSGDDTSNDLLLLDLSVAGSDGVALNTILKLSFSEALDPDSVRPETVQIRKGPFYGQQVFGHFRVDGAQVFFYPRLPTDDKLETSGFQAGTDYKVFLPAVPKVAVVRNFTSDRTVREAELYFKTAVEDDPNVFIDNFLDPTPPQILSVNPVDGAVEVPASAKITITFNRRPLDPRTVTADTFKLTMVEREGAPNIRAIAGGPVLTQSLESVQVVFQPDFPLPDEALFELTVSNRVEDLVGFSLPAFTSRFTIRDEAPRLATFRLEFTEQEMGDLIDENETTASWNGLVTDALAAIFTVAGGSGKSGDLVANSDLNLTPFNTPGVQLNQLEDGVFYDIYNFRKFEIKDGVTVRFQSSAAGNPVKILSVFPMKIDGTVSVTGGIGQNAQSYQYRSTKMVGRTGGTGGPGGATGGTSYAGTRYTSVPQPYGDDCPFGGYGGQAGSSGTYSSGSYRYCYEAGGGGGGGSRLAGDQGQDGQYPTTGFSGKGGKGGLAGAGNLERRPNTGGAGGGPGGYGFRKYVFYTYIQYRAAGGGGGGGGGGLHLQSASKIQVSSTGQVLAEGGRGGGTHSYYPYGGGAGGGGGGGSVKASSTLGIELASGAKLSSAGGAGGPSNFTFYPGSAGGDGGDGFLRLEAPSSDLITGLSGAALTYTPPSIGTFSPVGGGVPSIGQTMWANLGVFDPEMLQHKALDDRISELYNDVMEIYVQMSDEHPTKLGEEDLRNQDVGNDSTFDKNTLSEWVKISDIPTLSNFGYQFLRVRVIFQLDDNQKLDDPLPYLDRLDINFRY